MFFEKKKGGAEIQTGNEITRQIIEKVKCPGRIFAEGSSAELLNQAYEEARKRGEREGFIPVLVPSDDTLCEWLGILEDEEYSREELLNQACDGGREWLWQRYEEYARDYAEDYGEEGESAELPEELVGELSDGEELDLLTSFLKFDGVGSEETILFEIPVQHPWEVIAWLPMGGWNECPEAQDMMAVCRYWYEEYGAVPAVISHDTMEFVLSDRVSGEEEAWKLAREHFAFTPDRVDQCTASGTLGEVAECIRKSRVWYFWWD